MSEQHTYMHMYNNDDAFFRLYSNLIRNNATYIVNDKLTDQC